MNTFCSYFNAKTCQSCRFIEVNYSEQLRNKENRLKAGLSDFNDWVLLPTVESQSIGFRNKAKMVVTGSVEEPVIGLSGEKFLDDGREILNCPVHVPEVNQLLAKLPEFIRLVNLAPYRIAEKKGELKGVIAYYSQGSNECYLRFILRSKEPIDRIKKHLPVLIKAFPSLVCVSVNIQPVAHAILEGDEEIILTDRTSVKHIIHNVELNLGPKGFVQTNQQMAQRLYETAAEWARDLHIKKFVELFCGQGAFSFFMADFVEQSVGFEINPDAVSEANATVKKKGIQNLNFKCADAANVGSELRMLNPELVLVNPPRRGLADSVELFKETPWPYIIYSSCSLESLEKDLKALKALYTVQRAQIFDMFPHTEHFETLVLLKSIS